MNENKEKITMKGNEKDCICAKQDGKHTRRCDAYRLSEFEKKMVAVLVPTPFNYNELSHIHCWEQQNPPCGKKEHARCCLCEKYNPCNWCTDGTKCDGDCNCKCHQPTQEKKCVFCDIANRAGVDIVDIEPLNPVVKGHRIVFSKQHSVDFTDDIGITMRVMQRAAELAKELGGDFNLITSKGKSATQSVFHLHVHLVPQMENDGLHLPWTGQKKEKEPTTQSSWREELEKMSLQNPHIQACSNQISFFISSIIGSKTKQMVGEIKKEIYVRRFGDGAYDYISQDDVLSIIKQIMER